MKTQRNPVIRVYPHTRRKLKMLAAMSGETMQETVERLVSQELGQRKKGEQTGEKSLQIPPLSQPDH
jgi:hypothetical protein